MLQLPPWPNGQGVGLLIRRLRVRVPQGVFVLLVFHTNARRQSSSCALVIWQGAQAP